MAAHDDMKVNRARAGRAQARTAPGRPVKFCKIPVLGLTMGSPLCYDKLQAENIELKVQKTNLVVATQKLGEKITNLETGFEKIQNLIENDNDTKRGKLNTPAVGGS